jgi:hypothetical protein
MISPPSGRLVGRIGVVAVALVLLSLVAAQYARVIARNVALARELHEVQQDVVALREKRGRQLHEISRLSDPRGAIPEVHDRLHLVGDHEAIIYLKGANRP